MSVDVLVESGDPIDALMHVPTQESADKDLDDQMKKVALVFKNCYDRSLKKIASEHGSRPRCQIYQVERAEWGASGGGSSKRAKNMRKG